MWFVLAIPFLILVSILAGVFLTLWVIVPHAERMYVFRPSREVNHTPAEVGLEFEKHCVQTKDNCQLAAWWIEAENPIADVIYFHGNGGNLGILNEIFLLLSRHRLRVFAVDYRGYGMSTGSPSEEGLYLDAIATVSYVQRFSKDSTRPLIYWGRSLGGCVAAYASSQKAPDGLVLEGTFPNKRGLVQYHPHFKYFHPFSRYKLDTLAHLKGHSAPVLVIHGDQDRTVPIALGESLANQLEPPVTFLRVAGANHVNTHRTESERYMTPIVKFIKELPGGNSGPVSHLAI